MEAVDAKTSRRQRRFSEEYKRDAVQFVPEEQHSFKAAVAAELARFRLQQTIERLLDAPRIHFDLSLTKSSSSVQYAH